jgi:predicted P-loop ATPase
MESKDNKQKQESRPIIHRIKDYLFEKCDYRINIVSNYLQRKEANSQEWKSTTMNDIEVELYECGMKGFKDPLKALFGSKSITQFDPFVDYFNNLCPWDTNQEDYIKSLVSFVKTDNDEWFEIMFKKWLVRCVGQAIGKIPFNKQCLTLVGKQNDGKTTFLDYLIPYPLKDYAKKGFDFGSKEGKFSLVQNFFVNLDELAAFDKKELNNEFKTVLSESIVKYRPLFQNTEVPFQRRASFVASTNHFEFLTDETGNVRWLPFIIKNINHDNGGTNGYTSVDINRVWAQAFHLLNSSTFKNEMTPAEINQQENLNRRFLKTTTEMEVIDKHFEQGRKDEFDSRFYTASDLEEHLRGKVTIKLYRTQIGKALQVLGIRQESSYDSERGYSCKGYYLKLR